MIFPKNLLRVGIYGKCSKSVQNGKKKTKMKKIASKWTAEVLTDKDGEFFIEFSDEFLREIGWKEGDTIEWIDNHDGSFTLKKKDT
jgi:hypothetical protein